MPPENETKAELTEEQKTQQEQEAEAGFSAGFKKARGDQPSADIDDDKAGSEGKPSGEKEEKEVTDDKGAAAPAAATKPPAAAPAADPWEGVPKVVREQLESLGTLSTRMRNVEGHIGGLNGTLQQLTKAGKTAAADQGAAAPSDAQVAAAINDDEEFLKLKEQYPEWAGGIEKQMSVIVARAEKEILKKVQPVDTSAIATDVLNRSSEIAHSVGAEVKKIIPLYVRHPDWEDTTKTPEFIEWAYASGPTEAERKHKWSLEDSDPRKASEYLNELIRKYPQWWAGRGSLIDSSSPTDAIKMMDAYTEFKAAQAASTTKPAEKSRLQEKNQQRLKAATVPKGSQQPPPPGVISDNDAFNKGFKKVRKA